MRAAEDGTRHMPLVSSSETFEFDLEAARPSSQGASGSAMVGRVAGSGARRRVVAPDEPLRTGGVSKTANITNSIVEAVSPEQLIRGKRRTVDEDELEDRRSSAARGNGKAS